MSKNKNKNKNNTQMKSEAQKVVIPHRIKTVEFPKTELRFSPTAWHKILYMREIADVEVSGFGISSRENPLLVEDFVLIKQVSSIASTDMDDESVSDHMENMAELGYQPAECMRIWIHTHPSSSAFPSSTDKETFLKAFGNCNWAVMFIMAKGGVNTAHMLVNAGVKSVFKISTCIDYSAEIIEEWDREVEENVEKYKPSVTTYNGTNYVIGSNANEKNNHYRYEPEYYGYLSSKHYEYGYGFDELMDDDFENMFDDEEEVPI